MTINPQSTPPFSIMQLDSRQILESLQDCVKILDLEGRLCYMNKPGQKLLDIENFNGYLGRSWIDFWQGKDQQAAIEAIEAAKSGKYGNFQGYCPTMNGAPCWWDVIVSPICNAQGEVEQLLSVSRNITHLKQTEQQLRQQQAQLEMFGKYVPAEVAMLDREMRYLYVSDRWLSSYGLASQEVIGQSHYEIFPNLPPKWIEVHQRCLAGAVEKCDEDPFLHNGGLDWIRWEIRPWYTETDEIGGIIIFSEVITERKRAEQQLQIYADVVQNTQVGLVVWQLETPNDPGSFRLLIANAAASEITAVNFAALIGQTMATCFPELLQTSLVQQYLQVIQTQQAIDFGEVPYSADGVQAGIYTLKAFPLPNGCFGLAFENITARKALETALNESEQRFRLMADAVPQIVWITDAEGRVEFFNKQWSDYTGVPYEPTTAAEVAAHFVHPDDGERTMAAFNEAQRTGGIFTVEHRIRSAAGSYRWFLVRAEPHRDSQTGKIIRWFGASIDIHDRKRAEEQLREREQRLTIATEAAQLGIFEWKMPEDIMIWENDRMYELFGLQPADGSISAQEFLENYLHPDDAGAFTDKLIQAMQTGTLRQVNYRIRRHDGTICWIEVNGQFEFADDGSPLRFIGVNADITDRKQAELEIQKFVSLADNSTEFIGMYDLNFVPFYVNEAGRRMVGLDSTQQYSETPVREFFFPEDQDFILNEFFPLVLHEGRAEVEIRFRHFQTGEALWMIYTVFYIRDEDNQPIGLATVSRNITDRKQAEAELRGSEARFRRIFECEMVPMGIYTPAGGIVEANNSLLNLIGYTRQELETGQISWKTLTPPEYRALDETAVNEVATRGVSTPYEKVYLHKDGRRIPILIGAALLLEDGSSGVFFAIDLSERKKAEAELRESETRYRLLAEAIPQFVWITDAAGHNEYVNQRFCDYTGLTAEQMHGLNWLSIIHPDDLEMTHDRWLSAVNSGQFYEIEYRFRRHDGSYRWFLGQGIPLKDEQGRILQWFGTCTDIEPQKQLEQTRLRLLEQEQAAREQAENANRIKDEFLAVLSHELRSPLNPILGWARLLQQGNLDATRTRTALETIDRNAQLQARLIDDLLDISRILRGKLSLDAAPVDLRRVIAAALETVHLAAEAKSLPIQTTISPDVGVVIGDAGRLQQVVWNLLSNAVKFTPQGGQIFVTLAQVGTYAQIQVSDTGKGIDPNFLPFVFEHFRQEDGATTRKFGGLGLGLAIARQIVEMHGGQISIDSPGEGQGTTFTVQLPLTSGLSQSSATASPAVARNGDLQGIHILVVDDELDSREFVAFVLEQTGAIVTSVASGIEALQIIELAALDLIISDIGMPEMDGYMLMQQGRRLEQGRTVPAIALTAYAGEFERQQALQAGFQHYLTKPVEPAQLVREVLRLLKNR